MSILHLTDEQANAVFAAAHPLPPDRRAAFLEDVAKEIFRHSAVIGDGSLYRLIVQVQRRHYDAPLEERRGRPKTNAGKYA